MKTLTIGIPAYNEEQNISHLLNSLLIQKLSSLKLENIIVYSDASTDKTHDIVRSLKSKKIRLICASKRRGQAYAQQKIIDTTNSDYLVLLNADVLPKTTDFINRLVNPMINGDVEMTSPRVVALPGRTIFSKIISWSHEMKMQLYLDNVQNDSVYLCHGRARAFSRKLYSKISFPNVISEDAYTYFVCKSLGYKFSYIGNAQVLFAPPANLSDHLLQSRRYFRGTRELEQYFPKSILDSSYHITFFNILKSWVNSMLSNPLYFLAYIAVLTYSYITSRFEKVNTGAIWAPSPSSKRL